MNVLLPKFIEGPGATYLAQLQTEALIYLVSTGEERGKKKTLVSSRLKVTQLYQARECLTFLENPEIRRVQNLIALPEPLDAEGRASTDPALQNHQLTLWRLDVLQELRGKRGWWVREWKGRGNNRRKEADEWRMKSTWRDWRIMKNINLF